MMLSEKLYTLRKQNGISQAEFAEVLSVSRQAVSKWEIGEALPSIDNLVQISNRFKISLDHLLKDDDCSSVGDGNFDMENHIGKQKEWIAFLLRAKQGTYAGKGELCMPCRKNSLDYEYEEGNYTYYDSYLGGKQFAGEEGLWIDKKPVWAMNYAGTVLAFEFSGDFLKEALLNGSAKIPYRGPYVYCKGAYTYHMIVSGDFTWFQGEEEIIYEGKRVYECYFHGGTLN